MFFHMVLSPLLPYKFIFSQLGFKGEESVLLFRFLLKPWAGRSQLANKGKIGSGFFDALVLLVCEGSKSTTCVAWLQNQKCCMHSWPISQKLLLFIYVTRLTLVLRCASSFHHFPSFTISLNFSCSCKLHIMIYYHKAEASVYLHPSSCQLKPHYGVHNCKSYTCRLSSYLILGHTICHQSNLPHSVGPMWNKS